MAGSVIYPNMSAWSVFHSSSKQDFSVSLFEDRDCAIAFAWDKIYEPDAVVAIVPVVLPIEERPMVKTEVELQWIPDSEGVRLCDAVPVTSNAHEWNRRIARRCLTWCRYNLSEEGFPRRLNSLFRLAGIKKEGWFRGVHDQRIADMVYSYACLCNLGRPGINPYNVERFDRQLRESGVGKPLRTTRIFLQ